MDPREALAAQQHFAFKADNAYEMAYNVWPYEKQAALKQLDKLKVGIVYYIGEQSAEAFWKHDINGPEELMHNFAKANLRSNPMFKDTDWEKPTKEEKLLLETVVLGADSVCKDFL